MIAIRMRNEECSGFIIKIWWGDQDKTHWIRSCSSGVRTKSIYLYVLLSSCGAKASRMYLRAEKRTRRVGVENSVELIYGWASGDETGRQAKRQYEEQQESSERVARHERAVRFDHLLNELVERVLRLPFELAFRLTAVTEQRLNLQWHTKPLQVCCTL